MKHIIFDLDDVLFNNTGAFKQALNDVFIKYGVDFYKTYKLVRETGTYSIEKHLQIVSIKDKASFGKDIEELFKKLSEFLFDDVQSFFQDEKVAGYKCSIVTRGDKEFQKKKVLYLKDCIPSNVYYVEKESKAEKLLEISKPGDVVYFVDDVLEELMDVKNNFPTVITVLIKRYREPTLEEFAGADRAIVSLEDLKKILV